MDLELQRALEDCVRTAGRLLDLLERDRDDIPRCINGEILAVYLQGLDKASRMTRAMRQELETLQMTLQPVL